MWWRKVINWPDKLKPDWCRLRTGWLGCLAGDVLAEEAGVMALGVIDTSHTGPSYSPLGTPLSSASCGESVKERERERERARERKRDGTFQLLENRVWHHLASICKAEPYPAASFYPLVNVVGEGFSGHKAARALGVVKGSFLQDDLALADHHQGATADLSAFKNVVLHTLPRGNCEGKRKMCCKYSTFQA